MAVSLDANALAEATGMDAAQATRILPVATQMVEDYAPGAPTVLQDEAVVRFGGYLAGQQYGNIAETAVGPLTVSYTVNHAAAFRNSGAAMLLTRHRVPRGGAI